MLRTQKDVRQLRDINFQNNKDLDKFDSSQYSSIDDIEWGRKGYIHDSSTILQILYILNTHASR